MRTAKTGTATSRIPLSYRAKFLDAERMELTLDGLVGDPGILQLRVYDPNGTVVCERVVRSWPYTINFKAVPPGRYQLELSTMGAGAAKSRFTWSDFDTDFGGSGSAEAKLPSGVVAFAFIDAS